MHIYKHGMRVKFLFWLENFQFWRSAFGAYIRASTGRAGTARVNYYIIILCIKTLQKRSKKFGSRNGGTKSGTRWWLDDLRLYTRFSLILSFFVKYF